MSDFTIEETQKWVLAFVDGYIRYMMKHHIALYHRFISNIHPPKEIGGCVTISKGRIHSAEDVEEILKVSEEFCAKYPNPYQFPKEF